MVDTRQTLHAWLFKEGLNCPDLESLTDALMDVFERLGYPVDRLNVGCFILHPELAGLAFQRTSDGDELTVVEVRHEDLEQEVYLKSPLQHAVRKKRALRWRLGQDVDVHYPFWDDLREEGFSDYLVFPMIGVHSRVHVISLATKSEGGFSEEQWAVLDEFRTSLALLVDVLAVHRLAEVLLQLYVGKQSGSRVLSGSIRRGQGKVVEAAVLFCDLNGFTGICESLSERDTIQLLNGFLDRICGPVADGGGEILKFVGDAVLAIFPANARPVEEACRAAILAAKKGREALRAGPICFGRDQSIWVSAGMGLHVGTFHYGNIGTGTRLDFTAIGDAINVASRVEAMCGHVERSILATQVFVDLAGAVGKPLGNYPLKGVSEPVGIVALD